jgi:hypothetical protein
MNRINMRNKKKRKLLGPQTGPVPAIGVSPPFEELHQHVMFLLHPWLLDNRSRAHMSERGSWVPVPSIS